MAVNYTLKLGLSKPDRGTKNWETLWQTDSDNLESRLTVTFAGEPTGEITGDFVGQRCQDIVNGYLYWWTGTTWEKVKSGLTGTAENADNLGGEPPSYYTNIVGRLGYTPVNKGGDLMTGALRGKSFRADTGVTEDRGFSCNTRLGGALAAFPSAGVNDYLYLNTWMNGSTRARSHAAGVWAFGPMILNGTLRDEASNGLYWHSGNDGSGSGLDADLLDGMQSSSFVRSVNGQTPSNGAVSIETVPPGTIMFYANAAPPAGWLHCNGAGLSTSTFSNLFAAIGTRFGSGSGTFFLPDLRGLFLRAYDASRGMNPDGNVFGTFHSDMFATHTHNFDEVWPGTAATGYAEAVHPGGSQIAVDDTTTEVATRTSYATGGPETRPRYMALLAIIKY